MTTESCRVIGRWLGSFADDELTGAERLRVSRHLETCESCRATAEDFRGIGDLLRSGGDTDLSEVDAAGFAQGIVSRSRAEASLSWPVRLRHACDDWHWVIVGSGALGATVMLVALWSALVIFGPAPVRQDSLAGLIGTLELPRSDRIMRTGPDLLQQDLRLVPRGGSRMSERDVLWLRTRAERAGRMSAAYAPGAEATYVGQLAALALLDVPLREAGPAGPGDDLLERSQGDLLDVITRLRLAEPLTIPHGTGARAGYVWR